MTDYQDQPKDDETYEPPTITVVGSLEALTKVTVSVLEGSICANFPDHASCQNEG